MTQISKEAYENPDFVKNAPYNAPIHNIENPHVDDYEKIATTWRQWVKRKK